MIKKLQIKFVCILMSILSVVFVLILTAVNVTMFEAGQHQSDNIMQEIARNDGRNFGKKDPPRHMRSDDFSLRPAPPRDSYCVLLDAQNEVMEVIMNGTDTGEIQPEELAAFALEKNKNSGMVGEYRFLISEKPYGKIIVFLDYRMELTTAWRLLWISVIIGIFTLLILLAAAVFLSRWAVRPVKLAFEAQRQFVADASHELKTPLTVISANADVLNGEIGENQWLGYIQTEIRRMSGLVGDLLYLAKADSTEMLHDKQKFSLSEAVMSVVLPFESVAFEQGITFTLDVAENVFVCADEQRIQQVAVILLDNALKHANLGGEVRVLLSAKGAQKLLAVYNTGEGIDDAEKEKIFKRFYRSDSSRARETGGYGLGLSIAKTIVDTHGGKISVDCEKGKWIRFTVTL